MQDFAIHPLGSLAVLVPLTEAAETWCTEYLPDDCLRWGSNGYVIEHRYIGDILTGLDMEGLTYA